MGGKVEGKGSKLKSVSFVWIHFLRIGYSALLKGHWCFYEAWTSVSSPTHQLKRVLKKKKPPLQPRYQQPADFKRLFKLTSSLTSTNEVSFCVMSKKSRRGEKIN